MSMFKGDINRSPLDILLRSGWLREPHFKCCFEKLLFTLYEADEVPDQKDAIIKK